MNLTELLGSHDPLEQFHSPYLANFNNPANFVDPDGRLTLWQIAGSISTYLSGSFNYSALLTTGSSAGGSAAVQAYAGATIGVAIKFMAILNMLQSIFPVNDINAVEQAKSTTAGAGSGHEIGHAGSSTLTSDAHSLSSELNNFNTNSQSLHNDYYYNRWGTLIKIEPSNRGKSMIWVANDDSNFGFTGYDVEFVKRYVAVVVGEAGSREDAAGIGVVIMNRFDAYENVGKKVLKNSQWVENMGGEDNYKAVKKTEDTDGYPAVMKMNIDDLFGNGLSGKWGETMAGALSALSSQTKSEVNTWLGTPHFWEGTGPYKRDIANGKETFFTTNMANGILKMTGEAGGSYFFNYSDINKYLSNRKWP
ncbi:MAG: hypothetical protein RLZZ262_1888 [Bacteroidota bacterium]|jgi:hypothetical protein